MNSQLVRILRESTFNIHEGNYLYIKVQEIKNPEEHFMTSHDADEITVVTKEENLDKLEIIEANKEVYKLIEIRVSIPFYSVGFLAEISKTIAKENINLLIISTYSKDYIMVSDKNLNKTKESLSKLGLQIQ